MPEEEKRDLTDVLLDWFMDGMMDDEFGSTNEPPGYHQAWVFPNVLDKEQITLREDTYALVLETDSQGFRQGFEVTEEEFNLLLAQHEEWYVQLEEEEDDDEEEDEPDIDDEE